MEPLNEEIARIEAEIARLQGERTGLLRAKELLTGEATSPPVRKRASPIKPLVLDIMREAGSLGPHRRKWMPGLGRVCGGG
jgi:hypothetical protein